MIKMGRVKYKQKIINKIKKEITDLENLIEDCQDRIVDKTGIIKYMETY